MRGQDSTQSVEAIALAHEWERRVSDSFGGKSEGTVVRNGKMVWSPADIRFDDGTHLGEVKVIGAMESLGMRKKGTTNGKVHM